MAIIKIKNKLLTSKSINYLWYNAPAIWKPRGWPGHSSCMRVKASEFSPKWMAWIPPPPYVPHTRYSLFLKNRRTENHVLQSPEVFWNDSINTSVFLAILTTQLDRMLLKNRRNIVNKIRRVLRTCCININGTENVFAS